MRLLLHDTLATAPVAFPLTAGWVVPDLPTEARAELRAADLGPEDVALIPSAEVLALQATHRIVPDVAVVAGRTGAVAMRTPTRADEVERSPVRLWDVSGTAELLARATVQPFYGILPLAWTPGDAVEAQVVIVEGAEALRSPEAGFAEDLCRAWLILTDLPAVTHVLVAPDALDRDALQPALAALGALGDAGHERRRDLRHDLAAADDLDRDRLAAFFVEQRLSLDTADRRALVALLQRGGRGSSYPALSALRYLEPAG